MRAVEMCPQQPEGFRSLMIRRRVADRRREALKPFTLTGSTGSAVSVRRTRPLLLAGAARFEQEKGKQKKCIALIRHRARNVARPIHRRNLRPVR